MNADEVVAAVDGIVQKLNQRMADQDDLMEAARSRGETGRADWHLAKRMGIHAAKDVVLGGDWRGPVAGKGGPQMSELNILTENEPLTLDELRQMDGEPAYIVTLDNQLENPPYWAIVGINGNDSRYQDGFALYNKIQDDWGSVELYGKTWLAYRRKPERSEAALGGKAGE